MQNSRNSHWLENGSLLGWLHLNVEADASVSPKDFVSGRNKFHFSFLQLHSNLARSWVKEKLLHHQGLHLIHKIKLDDSHFKKLVSLFHSGKILQKICLRASWLQLLMKLMISTQIKIWEDWFFAASEILSTRVQWSSVNYFLFCVRQWSYLGYQTSDSASS